MLQWIVLVLALIKALNACSPTNEHEQSIYCNTQYVFQGLLNGFNISSEYSTYRVLVTANLKGKIRPTGHSLNVYSSGYMNSCSPPSANVGSVYLFFVNSNPWNNRPTLRQLSPMSLVYRIYYQQFDCSCKIDVNMEGYAQITNQVPRGDKCVLDGNNSCGKMKGSCKRSASWPSTCQWIPIAC
ncbi:uncharacterized protein LOC111107196 [Crassostrea virginica]